MCVFLGCRCVFCVSFCFDGVTQLLGAILTPSNPASIFLCESIYTSGKAQSEPYQDKAIIYKERDFSRSLLFHSLLMQAIFSHNSSVIASMSLLPCSMGGFMPLGAKW